MLGGKCVFCEESSPSNLEFAHIKETGLKGMGRGKQRRYYDIKNHIECYRLMCKTHHKQFDDGEIKLEELK